ncbi:hypothetical protein [Actinoplanes sp. NPDC051494]|uniref:hypothetical protein n=1 Tax=Actinoplanes sp. NPDC051494 TaxID=3363907 RepID=UPI0037892B4D
MRLPRAAAALLLAATPFVPPDAPAPLDPVVAPLDLLVAPPAEYGMLALISGELTRDGRCLLLANGDARSVVIWPAGTRWLADEEVVVHPSGARIRLGDSFRTGGGHVPISHRLATGWLSEADWRAALACARKVDFHGVVLNPFSPIEATTEPAIPG